MTADENKRWIVAVDGGGSKIAIAAQLCTHDALPPDSLDSARLWTFAHCGSAHPTTWDAARRHLTEALCSVFEELAVSEAGCPVGLVLFALAGAGREADRGRVLQWAGSLGTPVKCSSFACVSDIEPLVDYRRWCPAQTQPEERAASVAVILGTGSMVAARDRGGRIVRAGGWGPHLGDPCSGGALGIAAVQCVAEWLDGGSELAEASVLVSAILQALSGSAQRLERNQNASAETARPGAHPEVQRHKLAGLLIETAADRAASARLAPTVLRLALEDNNAEALGLLRPQLEQLCWQIEQVVRRAGLVAAELDLVLSGGLAAGHAALRTALLDTCAARHLSVREVIVAAPVLAALRMAFLGAPPN